MAFTASERLRMLLGEEVPQGGSATDTMFSEAQIANLLELGNDVVEAAAYHGWLAKMAQYANLVTVNEGNASRELTELHKNAKRMVDEYRGWVRTPSRGRARIGSIVRSTS